MKKFILLFLLFPTLLLAEWEQLFTDNEDPSLFHHVNVLSGNLNFSVQDTVVRGAHELPLFRTYSSSGAFESGLDKNDVHLKKKSGGWLVQAGWSLLSHTNLFVTIGPKNKHCTVHLPEHSGNILKYTCSREEGKYVIWLKPHVHTGQASGNLSARTNPENYNLRLNFYEGEAVLFLPDGGQRVYRGERLGSADYKKHSDFCYHLVAEILPSKHRIEYSYEGGSLTQVATKNPANTKTLSWMKLDHFRKCNPFHFQVRTSDAKSFNYYSWHHFERDYLNRVKSSCRSNEVAEYHLARVGLGARVNRVHLNDKCQFQVHYYLPPNGKMAGQWFEEPQKKPFSADKVQYLEAPVGLNGQMIQVAKFEYSPSHTDVRDVDNYLIRYKHDSKSVKRIEYFDESQQIALVQNFFWKGNRLGGKAMFNSKEQALFGKTFLYDEYGNVKEEMLWGNLTGLSKGPFVFGENGLLNGVESYRKKYEYLPHFNLPILEQEENGPTYRYQYKPDTNLLTAKFTCDGEKIFIRNFNVYDEDHLLIEEIADDGTSEDLNDLSQVTQRQIKRYTLHPQTGLVATVTEAYWDTASGSEKLLRRVEYTYTPHLEVETEAVYDANGMHRYTLTTQYDDHGNVIKKTNPLGQESTYVYDEFNRVRESKEVGSLKKTYEYDAAHRPILSQEVDAYGQIRKATSEYDLKGRPRFETNFQGHTTEQKYDLFGRCIQSRFEKIKDENGSVYSPVITFTYDEIGNIASSTNPRGETTHTTYNTYRKPIHIIAPDGSEIFHIYNKNGTLAKTLYPDKTEVHYTYDILQRMRSKRFYGVDKKILSIETWVYGSFQLLSHTDARGLTTRYTYDGAGRPVAEEAEGRVKTCEYDALGFLERTSIGSVSHVEIHDVGGRVIEEWDEDSSDRIENRMVFKYNDDNRKIQATRTTSQGDTVDLFDYDGQGRLSWHQDPLGNVSTILYDDHFCNDLGQTVLQKTTTDPLGNATIETYDALGHLVQTEKKDPQAEIVALEEYFYDLAGNRIKRVTTVYQEHSPVRKISACWEHDSCGRVIKEIEAEQKLTILTYDIAGRVKTRTLPSGIIFAYDYDGLGRIIKTKSSDGTVHYHYAYKLGPEPTQIADFIHNTVILRNYNLFGELKDEKISTGLHFQWSYDDLGRCKQLLLPDNSSIDYTYTGAHLSTVQRHSSDHILLYQHHYSEFDPNGHVAEEELISQLGTLKTTHDLLERPEQQTSSWLTHSNAYGPSGLVKETRNTLFGDKEYTYDALNQLLKEGESNYQFDSVGNPTDSKVNDCNQILSSPICTLKYDLDGNPIHREQDQESTTYTYDALGRLRTLTTNSKRVTFYYDAFSRLLFREIHLQSGDQWTLQEKELYLYDHDVEIGKTDAKGRIKQLKVLGVGIQGEIGAAVAIEIEGAIYAPLHDFRGNIIALISSQGELFESYNLDAFGREENAIPHLNPWRFSSKRHEADLIFFGMRFYDPTLGRWLTPDPSGFSDGPNLYAYVRNNPLNRLDLFGLSSELMNENLFNGAWLEINIARMQKTFLHSDPNAMLKCQLFVGETKVNCIVSCGLLRELKFTPEERLAGKFNLFDHFPELETSIGAMIGINTLQNGINTSFEELKEMGRSLTSKIPEGTLFIGLYNRDEGFFRNLFRTFLERCGIETPIVCATRQFMVTVAESLHKVNPELKWMDFAHSESGIIKRVAIEGMTPEQQQLMKQHLIYFGIGPAKPMPDRYAFKAYNVYSESDHVTKRFAERYLDSNRYHIDILPCISKWNEKTALFADHGYMASTYQQAIDDQIKLGRVNYGFYSGRAETFQNRR